jgi:hypothetical protein
VWSDHAPCEHSAREKVQDPSELMGMRDLQKFGGVEALIELIRSGSPRVKEAATAAIANAMEESSETRNFFREFCPCDLYLCPNFFSTKVWSRVVFADRAYVTASCKVHVVQSEHVIVLAF